MVTCVQVNVSGGLEVVEPQPATVDLCSLVVISPGEMAVNPFALTAEQGTQISLAILAVWGLAFVVRLIGRALSIDDSKENHDD